MKSYSGLSDKVLDIVLNVDEEEVSLRQLIDDATEEDLVSVDAKIDVDSDGRLTVETFTAWTESYILLLIYTPFGCALIKKSRDP